MFWVASAPFSPDGHVNVSPKGLAGTLRILDCHKVWYEDCTGSGAETIAHLRENGRITILFHAFKGPPRIVRLFGKGTVHEFGSPEYEALLPPETRLPGSRSAIVVDIHKVGTSCGYAVPCYDFKSHRTQLIAWAAKKEEVDRTDEAAALEPLPAKGLRAYWVKNNTKSLDGLPAVLLAHKSPIKFKTESKPEFKTDLKLKSEGMKVIDGFFDVRHIISFSFGVLVTVIYIHRYIVLTA